MARNMNRVFLSGNLTADPEVRQLPSGQSLAKLRLAVNGSKKVGDEWQDVPNYFDISVFGVQAEWCGERTKGCPIVVEGRLQWREWETDDGQKRSAVDVVADNVVLPPREQAANNTGDEQGGSSKPIPF